MKLFLTVIFLLYCTQSFAQGNYEEINKRRNHIQYINNPETVFDLNSLPICSNYGCSKISNASISSETLEVINNALEMSIESPASEREALAYVIGIFEKVIGEQTNTQNDIGGTFRTYLHTSKSKSEQMDCIDESANTLLYLRVLNQKNKIIWHEIISLSTRGGIFAGYPHTAVLLKEKQSQEKFIIDSWFHDNAQPAEVVDYKKWKKGWKPNKK